MLRTASDTLRTEKGAGPTVWSDQPPFYTGTVAGQSVAGQHPHTDGAFDMAQRINGRLVGLA